MISASVRSRRRELQAVLYFFAGRSSWISSQNPGVPVTRVYVSSPSFVRCTFCLVFTVLPYCP
jgi:hypothetical protein